MLRLFLMVVIGAGLGVGAAFVNAQGSLGGAVQSATRYASAMMERSPEAATEADAGDVEPARKSLREAINDNDELAAKCKDANVLVKALCARRMLKNFNESE